MTESTLSVGKTEIDRQIADFLGYSRTSTDWTDLQQARVDDARKSGLSDFYSAWDWTFLSPNTTLTMTADSGSSDLPDDFGSMRETFYYAADIGYAPLILTSVGEIKKMISATDSSGITRYAAISAKSQTGVSGSRYEALWYPYPDTAYVLTYGYNVLRNDLTAALPYPAGGAAHRETVLAACLAAADRLWNDNQGGWEARFRERLQLSIRNDGRLKAGNLGPNRDRSDGPRYGFVRNNYCTYEGSLGT